MLFSSFNPLANGFSQKKQFLTLRRPEECGNGQHVAPVVQYCPFGLDINCEYFVYLSPGYNVENSARGKCRRVLARVAGGLFLRRLPLGIRVLSAGGYTTTK